MTLTALCDSVDIILRTKGALKMRKLVVMIIIAIAFVLSACQSAVQPAGVLEEYSEQKNAQIQETNEAMLTIQPTDPLSEPTVEPTKQPYEIPTKTLNPTSTDQPVESSKPKKTVQPAAKPTQSPAPSPTETPLPIVTTEPSTKPTPELTEEPTPEPTPEPTNDITPVSSSYVNAAMAEINRLREANGVAPANFSSSISSSCQSHASKMAESGSAFHASGAYMFEAVGRASNHMPGGTMGGSAANHVVQLQTAKVTKIGIAAVYCGDYVYYVVRGD